MASTAKQARAGRNTVIIDSDDTEGEGNPSSQANTTDNATRANSETSDAEGATNEPVNSEDELGE
jgi:hypothetical protein